MSSRYITLGTGCRIGLRHYIAAWRQCLALPPDTHIGPGSGWSETAGEALTALRYGLEDRINAHLPWYGKGRKWSPEWYWPVWRASRDLNTPRLRIYALPGELQSRFAHRLATRQEDLSCPSPKSAAPNTRNSAV